MNGLPDILALAVVVVAVPAMWLVVMILWRLSRSDPELRVLRGTLGLGLGMAVIVTLFAAIFVNNGLAAPPLDPWATQVITRGVLLAVSTAAALYWLRVVWRAPG